MIRIYGLILFLVSLSMQTVIAQEIYIVPKPRIVEFRDGMFNPERDDIFIQVMARDTLYLNIPIGELNSLWSAHYNHILNSDQKNQLQLILGIPDQSEEFYQLCQKKNIHAMDRIGEEGYILDIGEKEIVVAANSATGLFYGIQSIKQILRSSDKGEKLPSVKIIDWPDLAFRGVQDDISRGPVPTLDFMKTQVRRLSEMKINNLSYYIEHIVKTKSHGDFAPAHGAVPINEWKELCDYAAKYHMKIVGNFQSLGHFEEILAYPQYAPLGETERMLSPVREESFQFLQDIYAEMVPAFSSPYFNANCDETWDFGRGASKIITDSLGIGVVYSRFVNRINKEIKKHDKQLMIWGDIVLEHPEIFDLLDKDIILGTWNYSALDSFDSYLLPFKNSGFMFMFSCGVLNSERMIPDYKMTMVNIKNFVRDALKYGALGMLNTVWDDGGIGLFAFDWYGVAYGADQSWHSTEDNIELFNRRFDRGIYGDNSESLSRSIVVLNNLTDLAPTQEMNDIIFWKKVIPERRQYLQLDLSVWNSVAEYVNETEELQRQISAKYYKQDIDFLKFITAKYKHLYNSYQQVAEAAEYYHSACLSQIESRKDAGESLIDVLDILTSLQNDLVDLKDLNVNLWRMENREYWLDHIEEMYDSKITDYNQTITLLQRAIADFNSGFFLPPPNEVRLDIRIKKGDYFQYWLLCGPFPNIKWQGRETDYLKPMGGETKAGPIPGDNFVDKDGQQMYWIKYASPDFSKINLADVYEHNTEVLAYAFCLIESPCDQTVKATFGSNDGIQLFLNGKRIYKHYAKRSLIPDEDKVDLDLKKGKNTLLLKIDQNKGDWGFSFRLPDLVVRNHKYKYQVIN